MGLLNSSRKSGCPGRPRWAGGSTPRLRKLDPSGGILEMWMGPRQAFIEGGGWEEGLES